MASSIVALAISYQAAVKQAQLADGVHALGVIDRITLETPGGYYGAAYDSDKGEIFVTNADYGSVSVISDSNNTVVANIPSKIQSQSIAYDYGKGEIFEPNSEHGTVSVISDTDMTLTSLTPSALQTPALTVTPLQSPQSTPSPTSTSALSVQPKNGKLGSLTADYLILVVAIAVLVLFVAVIITTLRRNNVWGSTALMGKGRR